MGCAAGSVPRCGSAPTASEPGLVVAGSIGECVHVAGVMRFLELAAGAGWRVELVGQAVAPRDFVAAVWQRRPDVAAVGYRLSRDSAADVLAELARAIEERMGHRPRGGGRFRVDDSWTLRLVFGGTPESVEVARGLGLFEAVFKGGEEPDVVRVYLAGCRSGPPGDVAPAPTAAAPRNLLARIEARKPMPLLRHHFGPPTVEEAIDGAARIAEAGVLDVLSLAPDQNAQEHFFDPGRMNSARDGAGGTPYRTEEDLRRVWLAVQRGNHPLLRCYSGTDRELEMAELLARVIGNAWAAIPLCWYSRLDRRGPRALERRVADSLEFIGWHARRGIPVEVNEAHQWSLRKASDAVAVAAFCIAAENAKAAGVETYVAQFMFGTPPGTSMVMDLGKMLAKTEMIRPLEDERFRVLKQVRAGLLSFPQDENRARGVLAAYTMLGMALRPEVVHVVAYCEAERAAGPREIIASCRLAAQVVDACLEGGPRADLDPAVHARKQELIEEATAVLDSIRSLACSSGVGPRSPLTDPGVIARAVRVGLLDAPELVWEADDLPQPARRYPTRIIGGRCVSVDPASGTPVTERQRVEDLLASFPGARSL